MSRKLGHRRVASCARCLRAGWPSWEEPARERLGRRPLRSRDRLRVEPDRQARIGVAESGLGRLQVDALEDERRRRGSPEIVEAEALQASGLAGRCPDPGPEVLVAKRTAPGRLEDEPVGVGCAEATRGEVIGDEAAQLARERKRAPPRMRLRRPDGGDPMRSRERRGAFATFTPWLLGGERSRSCRPRWIAGLRGEHSRLSSQLRTSATVAAGFSLVL